MIAAAQDGDQIVFDPSLQGQTITLTSGQLAVTKSLEIEALGADKLAISGNHTSRIFAISGGVTVTLAGRSPRAKWSPRASPWARAILATASPEACT